MFYGSSFSLNISNGTPGRTSASTRKAIYLFNRLYWQARLKQALQISRPLDALSGQTSARTHDSRVFLGTKTVEIAKICGSEGRSGDFNQDFEPLVENTRDRWIRIAAARQQGITLPAVELIKVGNRYFVRDGHHRISVARAFGELFVDAIVIEWS
jgi:hypothetical protein